MTNPKSKTQNPKSTAEIINGLKAARQKNPDLADTIDLHCGLLEAQGRAAPVSAPALLAVEEVEQALQQDIPLLHLVPLSFDWEAVSRLAADICRIVAEHRPDLTGSLATIRSLLVDQTERLEELVNHYLKGESLNLSGDEDQPADPTLLAFILNQTLRPFLQSAIRDLQTAGQMPAIQNLKSKIQSPKSTCPMCGGPPDFAALVSEKNNEGHGRRLLCARCDTEWGYRHRGCPFCGQTEEWAYFPDEKDVFRLYVCDVCHHYLKTVDWRQTFAHHSLPVARVITVNMDLAAVQAGYGE